jgi:hypothetical protein
MQERIDAYPDINALLAAMRALSAEMSPADPCKPFHDTYLRTTEAVAAAIADGVFMDGVFIDSDWVERWDVAFAGLYLRALENHRAGLRVPGPWHAAFTSADQRRLPPLRLVLLGMNAHINFDLPLALLEVIPDPDWADHDLLDRRRTDHHRIDDILASRVTTEDRRLAEIEQPGDRTILDRVLTPFNRFGTRRFLAEARRKVWNNAHRLAVARRRGHLDDLVAELEALSHRRIEDLLRPGQVILELTRNGFGVELP